MLINDPTVNDQPATIKHKRVGVLACLLLVLGFVGVILLRNDFWNWHSARPLLFGFIPVGLWWQMMVSLGASGFMALCVKFAWPGHLEEM